MGRTEGAIKSLYHRTLLALRDELSYEELDGPNNNSDSSLDLGQKANE
jgi:hypothetical protein